MKLVDLDFVFTVPPEELEAKLSPRAIVEHAGTYQVVSVEEGVDATTVAVENDQFDAVLEFTEVDGGYVYRQVEDGPFAEMQTWITVEEGDEEGSARLALTSEFTFGGRFAFLKDWLASSTRRQELERLAHSLAMEFVDENGDESDGEGAEPSAKGGESDGEMTPADPEGMSVDDEAPGTEGVGRSDSN